MARLVAAGPQQGAPERRLDPLDQLSKLAGREPLGEAPIAFSQRAWPSPTSSSIIPRQLQCRHRRCASPDTTPGTDPRACLTPCSPRRAGAARTVDGHDEPPLPIVPAPPCPEAPLSFALGRVGGRRRTLAGATPGRTCVFASPLRALHSRQPPPSLDPPGLLRQTPQAPRGQTHGTSQRSAGGLHLRS